MGVFQNKGHMISYYHLKKNRKKIGVAQKLGQSGQNKKNWKKIGKKLVLCAF